MGKLKRFWSLLYASYPINNLRYHLIGFVCAETATAVIIILILSFSLHVGQADVDKVNDFASFWEWVSKGVFFLYHEFFQLLAWPTTTNFGVFLNIRLVFSLLNFGIKFISGSFSFLFDNVLEATESDPHLRGDYLVRSEQMLSIVCKSDWRSLVVHLHELFFQLINSEFIPHCFVLYINAEYFGVNLFKSWCDSGHFSVLVSNERTDWIFLVLVLRLWTPV